MIKKVVVFVLLAAALAVASVYTVYDLAEIETVMSISDTAYATGTVDITGLQDEQRMQTKYDGAIVEVWSSNVTCDSITDVGAADTVVVHIFTELSKTRQTLLYDTLGGVPETTHVVVTADSLLKIMDHLYMTYTMWDTNTTVSDSSGVVTCTLKTNVRLWKD